MCLSRAGGTPEAGVENLIFFFFISRKKKKNLSWRSSDSDIYGTRGFETRKKKNTTRYENGILKQAYMSQPKHQLETFKVLCGVSSKRPLNLKRGDETSGNNVPRWVRRTRPLFDTARRGDPTLSKPEERNERKEDEARKRHKI